MSLHLPSRRLVKSTAVLLSSPTSYTSLLPRTQRRQGSFKDFLGGLVNRRKTQPIVKNPLTEDFLKKKPAQPKIVPGSLAESSILEDEAIAGPKPERKGIIDNEGDRGHARNPTAMAAALDPDPSSRQRWERKMVIREIHKRGRLSRKQLLKRQERELMLKSHDFGTSVKKLVHLANQIKGKKVDDAIIQMRFSKKKIAKDVKEHLEHAKNEAIVRRGMGLGLKEGQEWSPITIMTNDKKRVTVRDPTTLYVSEAWCGKGLFAQTPDFRARGQVHMMKNRTTSMSVVLKEETTLVRIHMEREEKAARKKLWVQLPNRPITAQRQYYSW